MQGLADVLSNWLSIKLVYEARPFDDAAKTTLDLFEDILKEEYQCTVNSIDLKEPFFIVHVLEKGQSISYRYPREYAERMVKQIENQPEKYTNIGL